MLVTVAMLVSMAITSIIAMLVLMDRTVTKDMYNVFDSYNGFDSYNNHNNHNKFTTLWQAGNSLIFPEDFWLADASMVFQLQLCKYTVCRKLV